MLPLRRLASRQNQLQLIVVYPTVSSGVNRLPEGKSKILCGESRDMQLSGQGARWDRRGRLSYPGQLNCWGLA